MGQPEGSRLTKQWLLTVLRLLMVRMTPHPRPLSPKTGRGENRIALSRTTRRGEDWNRLRVLEAPRRQVWLLRFARGGEGCARFLFEGLSESSHVAAIGPARLGEFVSLLTVATFTEIEADDLLVLGVKEILLKSLTEA